MDFAVGLGNPDSHPTTVLCHSGMYLGMHTNKNKEEKDK
jgi:hypothetical protein